MDEAEPDWVLRAERLLLQALKEVQGGIDAIPTVDAVLAVLRTEAGELPAGELDGYPFPGEAQAPECICPPDLLDRGGFQGGCPVHSSLAIIPEEDEQ